VAHGIERDFHRRISGAVRKIIKRKNESSRSRAKAERLKFVKGGGLGGLDCQHLAAFVVAAGWASCVRRKRAAALAAFVELSSVPAVGGFARAQPHFGHLAFWNTHFSWS
jgi:hypothetical protein